MPKRVFISHSTEDLAVAIDVRALLQKFGIEGFVAHVDIELSQDWVARIIDSLRRCHGLIYILSKSSQNSDWTDQEAGFALEREIPVIPLSIGEKPWGFVSRYQAKRWNVLASEDEYSRLKPNARTLGVALVETRLMTLNELIRLFGSSTAYKEAILRQVVLDRVEGFSFSQVGWILELVAANKNLYNCTPVRNWIPRLVKENRGAVSYQSRARLVNVGIKIS